VKVDLGKGHYFGIDALCKSRDCELKFGKEVVLLCPKLKWSESKYVAFCSVVNLVAMFFR